MADTSELLHTIVQASNILFNLGQESGPGSKLSDRDRATINAVRVRLDAAKSRLQAEAPTISDAHVHCPACGQHVHFKFDAPITQRAQAEAPEDAEVAEIENRHEAHEHQLEERGDPSTDDVFALLQEAHNDRDALLAKLRARTSQAEAQAPTTAALIARAEAAEAESARRLEVLESLQDAAHQVVWSANWTPDCELHNEHELWETLEKEVERAATLLRAKGGEI